MTVGRTDESRRIGVGEDRTAASLAAIRRVLLNADLRRLEIAWTLSIAAQWALIVALLVYAYDLQGAFGVGLLGLARTLPTLIGVPMATTLGDRESRTPRPRRDLPDRPRERVRGRRRPGHGRRALVILAVAAVHAVATAAIRPLQTAIVPGLARSADELVASNVASSTGEAIGLLVGPAFGGLLLAFGAPVVALAGPSGWRSRRSPSPRSDPTAGPDAQRTAIRPTPGRTRRRPPRRRSGAAPDAHRAVGHGALRRPALRAWRPDRPHRRRVDRIARAR